VTAILLSILGLLALSTLAPSANAAACIKEKGTKFALCLGEPLLLTEGSFTIHDETDGTAGYLLKTTSIEIKCSVAKGIATLTAASGAVKVSNLKLEYSTCIIAVPASCRVKEPITTELLKGVIEELQRGKLLVTPQIGENFVELSLENREYETCLLAGHFKVKLSKSGQSGELCTANNLETTSLLQLGLCLKANSGLEFNKELATFEGSYNTKLLSKTGTEQKWAIIEGK